MNNYQIVLETVLQKSEETGIFEGGKLRNLANGEEKTVDAEVVKLCLDFVATQESKLKAYRNLGTVEEIKGMLQQAEITLSAYKEYEELFGPLDTAKKIYSDDLDYIESKE